MSIGTGIVLIVIGVILRFALNLQVTWINIHLVGDALMAAGVVVFVLGLIFTLRKRRSITRVESGVGSDGRSVTEQKTATTPDDPTV